MKVKATVSFCGAVSMFEGQVLEVQEGEILSDLLHCGYVVPVDKEAIKKPKKAVKADGKTATS